MLCLAALLCGCAGRGDGAEAALQPSTGPALTESAAQTEEPDQTSAQAEELDQSAAQPEASDQSEVQAEDADQTAALTGLETGETADPAGESGGSADMVVIVLDPGHDDKECCTNSHPDLDMYEQELNLAIGLACRDRLEEYEASGSS